MAAWLCVVCSVRFGGWSGCCYCCFFTWDCAEEAIKDGQAHSCACVRACVCVCVCVYRLWPGC
jgi:hypothetical protein